MSTPQLRIGFALCVLALAAIAACTSPPALNPRLEAARSDYQTAQSSPQARDMAQAEMRVAADSLGRADAAWKKGDDVAAVDHLAYLAKQQVALAQETGSLKAAQARVATATADTDRLRLAARTNEADAANQAARSAQSAAATSQAQAETSRAQAATSQRQADDARSQASASQQQAADSRQQAETARQQADAARQQAGNAQQASLALQAQIEAMNAKNTPRGLVVTIGDVLFDTGRSEIKPGGARHMSQLVAFLKEYPQRRALVEGFTDSQGGEAANEALSDRRAAAVRTALLDSGIAGDRISTKGYGEAYPVAGNDNASGRQMNRRVEIVLSDDSGRIQAR